jgi:hypothetical protein
MIITLAVEIMKEAAEKAKFVQPAQPTAADNSSSLFSAFGLIRKPSGAKKLPSRAEMIPTAIPFSGSFLFLPLFLVNPNNPPEM